MDCFLTQIIECEIQSRIQFMNDSRKACGKLTKINRSKGAPRHTFLFFQTKNRIKRIPTEQIATNDWPQKEPLETWWGRRVRSAWPRAGRPARRSAWSNTDYQGHGREPREKEREKEVHDRHQQPSTGCGETSLWQPSPVETVSRCGCRSACVLCFVRCCPAVGTARSEGKKTVCAIGRSAVRSLAPDCFFVLPPSPDRDPPWIAEFFAIRRAPSASWIRNQGNSIGQSYPSNYAKVSIAKSTGGLFYCQFPSFSPTKPKSRESLLPMSRQLQTLLLRPIRANIYGISIVHRPATAVRSPTGLIQTFPHQVHRFFAPIVRAHHEVGSVVRLCYRFGVDSTVAMIEKKREASSPPWVMCDDCEWACSDWCLA